MTWCSAALCGAADLGERHALDTKDGPDFEFDAPRGRLRVVPNAVGYCDTAFAIAPHRGEWLSEYALEPDCTIRVRLIDGARAIDPPSSDVLRIVRVKGAGILPKRSLRDGVVQVRFEEAGAYAISAKSFAGFAASEAVVVEARLGEVVDVTLNVSARVEAH